MIENSSLAVIGSEILLLIAILVRSRRLDKREKAIQKNEINRDVIKAFSGITESISRLDKQVRRNSLPKHIAIYNEDRWSPDPIAALRGKLVTEEDLRKAGIPEDEWVFAPPYYVISDVKYDYEEVQADIDRLNADESIEPELDSEES